MVGAGRCVVPFAPPRHHAMEVSVGLYINQTDLESECGTSNVVQWSNLDNTTAAVDAARVASAISYAEGDIESRFRNSRYAVPFSFGDARSQSVMQRIMAVLACDWLASARAAVIADNELSDIQELDQLRAKKKWADSMVNEILSGIRVLGMTSSDGDVEAPHLVG